MIRMCFGPDVLRMGCSLMKMPEKCLMFTCREEWRAWLVAHHNTDTEVWLLHSKKKAPKRFLALEEGVEEAMCFGWIDGSLQPVDSETYALRYSPRQSRSIWSVHNQARAEKLIQAGRMAAAGLEMCQFHDFLTEQ